MTPAYSVIFFTVASGAGYGLLFWTSAAILAGWWQPGAPGWAARAGTLLGLILVTAGLLSSTFHLGHPERAWRALTQWRSSWLSREGVLATVSYLPAMGLAAGCWLAPGSPGLTGAAGAAMLALAPAVVFSTAMIYASLKPIPRWRSPWVPPVYLAFAAASGALLALVLVPDARPVWVLGALGVLMLAWSLKLAYWRTAGIPVPSVSAGDATGLGSLGEVTTLESPHTSPNYVMKEMGFVIARRHAVRLRRLALLFGLLLPAAALAAAAAGAGTVQSALLLLAAGSTLLGLVVERWLFFAEARHVVTVFYGERAV